MPTEKEYIITVRNHCPLQGDSDVDSLGGILKSELEKEKIEHEKNLIGRQYIIITEVTYSTVYRSKVNEKNSPLYTK